MSYSRASKRIHNHSHRLDFDFSCYQLKTPFRYELLLTPESKRTISGELSSAIPIVTEPGGNVAGFIIAPRTLLRQIQYANLGTILLIGKTHRIVDPGILCVNQSAKDKMSDGEFYTGVKALCRVLSALDVRGETHPSDTTPDSPDYRTAGM